MNITSAMKLLDYSTSRFIAHNPELASERLRFKTSGRWDSDDVLIELDPVEGPGIVNVHLLASAEPDMSTVRIGAAAWFDDDSSERRVRYWAHIDSATQEELTFQVDVGDGSRSPTTPAISRAVMNVIRHLTRAIDITATWRFDPTSMRWLGESLEQEEPEVLAEPRTPAFDLRPGEHFVGDVAVSGRARIAGFYKGSITAFSVVVTETGSVEGRIRAAMIAVQGRASGEVIAEERLEVGPKGAISGKMRTYRLMLHEGSSLDGKLSLEQRPPPAAEPAGRGEDVEASDPDDDVPEPEPELLIETSSPPRTPPWIRPF